MSLRNQMDKQACKPFVWGKKLTKDFYSSVKEVLATAFLGKFRGNLKNLLVQI